ncbi:MAG: hypothetical protein QXP36_01840 [Conexivisphaerales archaeon]
MRIKIKNVYCPICHRQTYFTGEVVYEGKRTKVIEWKCADCGVIIKSRHDKLGKVYNQRKKMGNLSPNPVIWIRKGNFRDFLYFEVGRKLYAFRYVDVERLEKDEILAIPVHRVLE